MTEREEREYEVLKTVDDYSELIEKLDDMASNLSNDGVMDKVLFRVGKALDEKIKYLMKISKPWRKKQTLQSRRCDKKLESEEKSKERLQIVKDLVNSLELQHKVQQLQLQYTPSKKGFLSRIKALFHHKQTEGLPESQSEEAEQNALSQASSPKAEDPTPKVEDEQDEAKEGEVVEDNEEEVDDESSEDDEVLDF